MVSALARLCAIVVIVAATVSCLPAADEGGRGSAAKAEKTGTGGPRTDFEPLVKRFPILEGLTGAQWMSGTYGDSDVPGPSTYWIDAVVTLPPARLEELAASYAPTATGAKPDVVEGMRAQLPAGPFLTSGALDAAFRHERWGASVFLDPVAGKLVLVATGT